METYEWDEGDLLEWSDTFWGYIESAPESVLNHPQFLLGYAAMMLANDVTSEVLIAITEEEES